MRFPKPPKKALLVKLVFDDGTYEIVQSPFDNIDETIYYYREVCAFHNGKYIVEAYKYNFD